MSLVRPLLEYATAAWDPYRKSRVESLEQVQRRAARFVQADYRRTSSVSAMLQLMDWPTLETRRQTNRLIVFYKAVNGLIAIPLDQLAHSACVTRQSSSLHQTYIQLASHCDAYKFSFFPRTVKSWNSLNDAIRNKPSVDSFRLAITRSAYTLSIVYLSMSHLAVESYMLMAKKNSEVLK